MVARDRTSLPRHRAAADGRPLWAATDRDDLLVVGLDDRGVAGEGRDRICSGVHAEGHPEGGPPTSHTLVQTYFR
jgi:hypothetical protein